MLHLLTKYRSWSRSEKKLFLYAILYIIYYLFILHILPGKKLQRHFGNLTTEISLTARYNPYLAEVRIAIRRAVRFLHLRNKCLAYALAAKKMLAKQAIPCFLHIGFRKYDNKLHAHAWLIAMNENIVGAENKEDFQVLAIFGTSDK